MSKALLMRGILAGSEILDYINQDEVEKKIEALLEEDDERRAESMEEFKDIAQSSLPEEEKEKKLREIMNECIAGRKAVEKEQRMAALKIREDYALYKKCEKEAFNALVSGNIPRYDRAVTKAAEMADMVDMGLEFIENAPRFFSNLKVTKVRMVSEEEALEHERNNPEKVVRLKNFESMF